MNRQKALNQLRLMQAWHEDNGNGPCPDYDAICYAIGVIEEAPEGLDNLIKALEQEHKKLLEMQKAQPEQRTDLLKAEIKRMKRSFTACPNTDYYTGYMSALSAVEGCIAQWEGGAE